MTLAIMFGCKDTINPVDKLAGFKKNAESADKAYNLFEKGNSEVFIKTVLNDEEGISKISTCKKVEKFKKES